MSGCRQTVWLGSPQQLALVRMEELSIGGAAVAPVDTARDLGVTLDAHPAIIDW